MSSVTAFPVPLFRMALGVCVCVGGGGNCGGGGGGRQQAAGSIGGGGAKSLQKNLSAGVLAHSVLHFTAQCPATNMPC